MIDQNKPIEQWTLAECVEQMQANNAAMLVEYQRLDAENARLRHGLELLVNLHDGIDDGGGGIEDDDWAAARAALKEGK